LATKKAATSKYGRYIISGIPEKFKEKMAKMRAEQEAKTGKKRGDGPGKMLLYNDGDYNEGTYYFQTQWVHGVAEEGIPPVTHDHSYDEYLGFFGSDTDHPEDLCGEIEVNIGGEKHTITKSCVVFIPKGTSHCPMRFKRVDKPIFYFATAPITKSYGKENIDKYKQENK
jgi:hypothetical protein